ncbi:iron uptake porin [Nostoc sp. FACHB-152]|uniref:iron uptake porin n=1 Tax=unclassified Nostoc TaxID=2593658 RepID=UPI001688187E|nr:MULTISPECIES: iron uptake porin [unclassified Nostoc]MBD2447304.1 iron uptake porin [Nostoc sp. FACHB-152]MBD2468095.1 iron uptake porin [Nostoc sp. FACHB-145]
MTDISLLMLGVLTSGQTSPPNNLPEQPVIPPEQISPQQTQEKFSQIYPVAETISPEFMPLDSTSPVTAAPANYKYQNLLKKIRTNISSASLDAEPSVPLSATTHAPETTSELSPSPYLPIAPESPAAPEFSASDEQMSQVTSVSQLDDVQPTDWAFSALQSLIERYGCIAGNANGIYLGNQSVTRYEFAHSLNLCLNQIQELINNQANTISREDLSKIQSLQTEFYSELQELQQRLDVVENKTNELEKHQFSTTTRLFGQAISSIQGTNTTNVDLFPRDGVPERQGKTNLTFTNSVQLTLATSFTGKDLLITGLSAGNLGSNASSVFNNMGRLSFESNTDNNVVINDLSYRFLVSDNLGVVVGTAGVNPATTFRGINPLEGSGDGAISQFGQRNPILNIGNGTGGIGFDWEISDRISFQGVYSAEIPSFPGNSNAGGLFGGRYTAGAQLTFAPTDDIDVGIHYIYSHSPNDLLGTGIGDAQLISPFAPTTAFNTHAVGATVAWRVNENLQLGGWGGFTYSKPVNLSGSVETTNWMVFAALPNLGGNGNLGGVLVGQPPKITSSNLPDGYNFPNFSDGGKVGGRTDTSLHLELFYRTQLNKNLSLTPGLLVIFNSDHNAANDTLIVGALRATFRF